MTLDDNRSLCRVQCYSPNLRALYGYNGVQKIGQKLLDIRSLINPIEKNANSHVNLEIANKNASEWIISAKDHINNISKNGGMARLELTFETDSFKDDSVIEKGVETLMKTFVEHTKVYSGKLVGNLAMISLLSFQGIFNALMLWFQPYQISDSPCWDTFGEVWNYLTYMAINFFSGKRTFETKAYYTPRLGYLFSRPFLNPSWTGINSAMRKTFVDQETFDNMKKLWYNRTEMIDEFHLGLKRLQSKTIQLNSEFETKFSAFKRLLSANCQSCKSDINEAIACSECKTITSVSESKNDSWLHHLCKPNENTRKNIKLNSKEFDAYVEGLAKSLSSSQQEAFEAIISSKQNCFLTGVAGSGKSFILKLLLPTLILSDGFSSILLTGTTNIAATNINGITLSKFMGLVVGESNDTMINCNNENQLDVAVVNHIKKLNEEKPSIIQNATLCKVLIIDEAGMCEKNQFHFLECFLRKVKNSTSPFGGVRIILIGDVLQLEPVGDAKNSSKTGGYFFEDVKFENFFVCYLRENHRQKDDKEFLEALNKVRVGDSSVLEYLNDNIFNMNVASFSTLEMAYKKLEKIKQTPDQWATIVKRAKFESLIIARNDPTDPDLVGQRKLDFQERLKKAPKNGFSDLVVCLEHNEREAYTDLRRENVEVVILEAADVTSSNYRAPDSISKKLDKKLERKLHAFIGMFCRVTYQTDNKYICSNTLVKIKDFTYSDEKTVQKITVETTSPDFQIVSVNIGRVTITEYVGKYEYKRTQFPLMSAVGLLPWSLQCLTISQNIFYDNSRSGSTLSCIKGLLYTVMSRVKLKEQFSFLHKVTEEEIRNGVNKKAKEFDDKYRLKSGQVLFNFNKLF